MTKRIDPAQTLADSIGDPALPPDLRDTAQRALVPRRTPTAPRLCAVGPCVHYHTFEAQQASSEALDGSPGPVHTRTFHYCYPDTGIETDLFEVPILSCNRYEPVTQAHLDLQEDRIAKAMRTEDGMRFVDALDAWRAYKAEALALALDASTAKVDGTEPIDEIDAKILMVMRNVHGSDTLPVHETGVQGAGTGVLLAGACVPDCARCMLIRKACDALLKAGELEVDDGVDFEGRLYVFA